MWRWRRWRLRRSEAGSRFARARIPEAARDQAIGVPGSVHVPRRPAAGSSLTSLRRVPRWPDLVTWRMTARH